MKKYIYISGIIAILILNGCEDLDREIITGLSEEQIITSDEYVKRLATGVYSDLPDEFLFIDGAMMASATDEAEHTIETSTIQKFNTGAWNALDNPDNAWPRNYRGIRKANYFLSVADSVNLDIYKLDPDPAKQATYFDKLAEIKRWKYEARFLRAFFYFELIKRYGGVPLITQLLTENNPAIDGSESLKRNTLEECIEFISNECDSAATYLPVAYSTEELGRATKVAALSLKSRVLLYAASDLFNDPSWAGGYSNPELVSLSGDRTARWKAAADAAKAVIDVKEALGGNYSSIFGPTGYINPEIIFVRRNGASNNFEITNYPIGYDLGQSGTTPSQNLVDAYEKIDGTKFNWNNPTDVENPYANRDPRLAMTILTNATVFKGRQVESWTGGRDGKGTARATRTGYYLKKYVNESLDLLQNNTSVHTWVFIRYTEIYLNYAEALNEYSPGNADITKYINKIRGRNGVKMPSIPNLPQAEMRERIRNERRVELAFEGHRFWDVRRWMQGPASFGVPIEGVEISKTSADSFTYNKIVVENRTFENKMYLYPIPQSELFIDHSLIQNPLW